MSIRVTDSNDRLRQFWDDTVGVRAYFEFDAAGVQTSTRPYTPEENARADSDAAAALVATNGTSVKTDVRAQIDTLKALIGPSAAVAGTDSLRAIRVSQNATINATPAPYIQAVVKMLIDVVQAEVRISRLVVGALDDTSSAPQVAGPK